MFISFNSICCEANSFVLNLIHILHYLHKADAFEIKLTMVRSYMCLKARRALKDICAVCVQSNGTIRIRHSAGLESGTRQYDWRTLEGPPQNKNTTHTRVHTHTQLCLWCKSRTTHCPSFVYNFFAPPPIGFVHVCESRTPLLIEDL